ncbi:MAG: hypothetical protein ACLFUQ_00035 [Candidatus Izemoplasmataceae bacterium]
MKQVIIMNVFHPKRGFGYYFRLFIATLVAVVLYGLVSLLWSEGSFWETIAVFWFLPFFVTFFIGLHNFLTRKMDTRKGSISEEDEFILRVSKAVRDRLRYDKEDFLKLREDEQFQAFLKQAYEQFKSMDDDEDLEASLSGYEFEEDSLAANASKVVIEETRRLHQKFISSSK